MRVQDIGRRLSDTAARQGTRAAISFALKQMTEQERELLWDEFGGMVLRALLRKYRPKLEIVRSINSVLAVAVPVGNTGNRATIESLRSIDLRRIALFREKMGLTMVDQAKTLRRIASVIGEGTIGESVHLIHRNDMAELLAIFKVATLKAEAA